VRISSITILYLLRSIHSTNKHPCSHTVEKRGLYNVDITEKAATMFYIVRLPAGQVMPLINRRKFLGGAIAIAACPLSAQTDHWQPVVNQARQLDQCNALVIFHEGKELLAERFRGPDLNQLVPIKSVSKTIVAALAGVAVDRGEIPSVESTLGELIPELIPANADPAVASISVKNLITMQAGLERTSGPGYNKWVTSDDWIASALSRPMVAEPGTRMLYSTGSYHILGAILSKLTGTSLLTLARYRLGRPLGMDIPAWTRDPQGRYLGGNEMALTIPAMVRFGEMYRNGGLAGRTRVLSEDWVSHSQQPATRSMFSGLAYGYGWFLGQSRGTSYALARGYGGQIICFIPTLALTVVITSDPTRPARSAGYFGDLMRLIEADIIPAGKAA
jgi:CubicO group peptidase (beta-lactamase class C family)